jgi:hypothetical protein
MGNTPPPFIQIDANTRVFVFDDYAAAVFAHRYSIGQQFIAKLRLKGVQWFVTIIKPSW